jgi:histidyl-tRNA synthetase
MTYRAPKGTDDVLPPESRDWLRAERTFIDLAETFGYDLVLTPHFEATELFERGVGEATEVVEKQMYTFTDKGGRSLTLRPEATASLVRAMIEAGGVSGTAKVAAWGPFFRYERPQAGRRRQFYQGDVEYFGEPSADADVEVIEFGYRYLEEMGVPDVVVALNSIGDADDRMFYRTVLSEWLAEREELLSEDARARLAGNPLRVLDSKADADVVADAHAPVDYLGEEAKAPCRLGCADCRSRIGSSPGWCGGSTTTTGPSSNISRPATKRLRMQPVAGGATTASSNCWGASRRRPSAWPWGSTGSC